MSVTITDIIVIAVVFLVFHVILWQWIYSIGGYIKQKRIHERAFKRIGKQLSRN
jgi:predicted ABC-type sugar transport system permease subunit